MSHTKTDEQTGRTGRLVAGFVTALAASAFAFWTGWPADVDGAANAAGGDVKVGALSKIGEAELGQTVMDLEDWTWCHDDGLATALQSEGAVVLEGAALSGVLAPRP